MTGPVNTWVLQASRLPEVQNGNEIALIQWELKLFLT
jgi:hypothetical protein